MRIINARIRAFTIYGGPGERGIVPENETVFRFMPLKFPPNREIKAEYSVLKGPVP